METLYRKYRPLDFDSVVGQDAIIKTLKNQVSNGNISHAYLFSGIRGTGKTTVARIFARAINCSHEIGGNPCNECETCKSALSGSDYNILELDAASNGNVESVRQITDSMQYPPINDEKYKVYIIDEAHALSGYSKEAFLKSLEEPPEYVVYILATTDPNKLPQTILSRCQKYNFKRIGLDTIVSYLRKICDAEGISIDDDALYFLAEKSDGSMRDSISLLDRCRSYTKENLSKEKILSVLDFVDDNDLGVLINAISEGNIEKAFDVLGSSIDKGKDINQFTNDLIWHLRNILIAKSISSPIETLNITNSNFSKLKEEAKLLSKDVIIFFIEELSKTLNIMRYDDNRRVMLETTLIRLANPKSSFIESAVMARLKKLEDIQNSESYIHMNDNNSTKPTNTIKNVKESPTQNKINEIKLNKLTFDEISLVKENWQAIRATQDMTAKAILLSAEIIPGNTKEPGFIEILLNEADYSILKNMDKIEKIEKGLREATQNILKKDVVYKLKDLSKTNYTDKVIFRLEDALDKIVGVPIEVEDDK